MFKQAESSKKNKTGTITSSVTQNKSGKQGFTFVDNRDITKSQKSLQFMINRGAQKYVIQRQTSTIQREYDLADNSKENKKRMAEYDLVLKCIDQIFKKNKIKYKLQGSMAQAMHGGAVLTLPGDLDILVTSPNFAYKPLIESGLFLLVQEGLLVSKVKHKETNVQVDLAQLEDFGMQVAETEEINGISVINLYETLKSLLLRPEKRPKDNISFLSLAVQRGSELTEKQQEDIAITANAPNWNDFYKFLLQKYKEEVLK